MFSFDYCIVDLFNFVMPFRIQIKLEDLSYSQSFYRLSNEATYIGQRWKSW